MKKMIFFFVVLLFSCNKKSTFTDADKKLISDEVKKMLLEYSMEIRVKGLSAEFKYLDSTDQFFWVPPGYKQAINYDSVKTAINNNAAKFKTVENTWSNLMVQPLTPELASYNGNIHSLMIDTAGIKTEMNLVETGMVIKRSAGWKLLCGQTSQIPQ